MNLLNDDSILVRKVYDPLIDVNRKQAYLIDRGGVSVSVKPYTTQNYSTSNIGWNIVPNNTTTCLSPYVLAKVTFQVTVTGTAVTGNLYNPNNATFGLRSWPLAQITNSVALQLNSSTFSSQPNYWIQALQHHRLWQMQTDLDESITPSLADRSWSYSDYFGASTNVLNLDQSSDYYCPGRGSYPVTVVSNTADQAVLLVTLVEPILCSPLQIDPESNRGFLGLTQMNIELQFGSLQRMFSYDLTNGNGITGFSFTMPTAPALLLRSALLDTIVQDIPREVKYPFSKAVYYTANTATFTPGAPAASMTASAIQLAQVPSKIFIFAQRQRVDLQDPDLGFTYSDAFGVAQNLSCTFNNANGLLSTMTPEQLWYMSRDNDITCSWPSYIGRNPSGSGFFNSTLGSVLCINPSKNFGLPQELSTGTYGQVMNFEYTVSLSLPATSTNTPVGLTLYTVVIYEGVLSLSGGASFTQAGILSIAETLNVKPLNVQPFDTKGSFYDSSIGQTLQAGQLTGQLTGKKLGARALIKRK